MAPYLLRPWRLYLVLPVLATALFLAGMLLTRPEYTAFTSFVTEARNDARAAAGIGGLASQLGLGTGTGALSPQYTAQVLTSEAILLGAAAERVPRVEGDSVPLRALLDLGDVPRARADELALDRLRRAVRATVNPRTGIVDVQVTLRDPRAAQYTAALLVRRLNEFNVARQRGQAARRRELSEALLGDARDSLASSERALRAFLEQNRAYTGSPLLSIEYERLQRQVSTYSGLYAQLRRDFESARMDEVNTVPVITVLDPPRVPARPSNRRLAPIVLTGAAVGVLVAVLVLAARAYMWRAREERPAAFAAAVGQLPRPMARWIA